VDAQAPQIPIIVLTGLDNEILAVEALRMGAQDYLVKGQFDMLLLGHFIRYAFERYENLEQLKRTKGALALSEVRFRNMIEKDADGILIVDNKGVVRFVNPAAEVLFSCKAEEFLGRLFGFPVVSGETIELDIVHGEAGKIIAEMRVVEIDWEGERAYLASLRDITERKQAEEERKKLILQLQDALEKVKTLSGLLPICSFCKKIRDDDGYWNKIETYIEAHSEAEFSHSMCQECAKKHYPQIYGDKDQEE
jgi:PAS domain-containing protein